MKAKAAAIATRRRPRGGRFNLPRHERGVSRRICVDAALDHYSGVSPPAPCSAPVRWIMLAPISARAPQAAPAPRPDHEAIRTRLPCRSPSCENEQTPSAPTFATSETASMTCAKSPLVILDAFPELGLIVKAPTGVRYSNQVAGYGCEHPEAEGCFAPLSSRIGRPLAALFAIFGGGWDCLDAMQANAVDDALRQHGLACVRVDRSMLERSWEAWIHVIISPEELDCRARAQIPLTKLSTEARAILIWPNCD